MSSFSARRPRGTDSGAHWISYSDMMAAILMVFVLAVVYSVYQYNTLLIQKTNELNEQQARLTLAQTELDKQKADNEAFRIRLQAQEEDILAQRNIIIVQQDELEAAQENLKVAQDDLAVKQGELEAALIILQAREADVQSLQEMLSAQEQKIETLVGIRPRIISDLSAALSASHIDAAIDPKTGDIKLKSYVFFDTNRSEIKQSGLDTLNRFLPVYLGVLMRDEYKDYVAEIIVEGHTDSSGSYLDNLKLSQNRALAVADYCFRMNGLTENMKLKLQDILTATGRSESDLIYRDDGTEDQESSRRVEFKFRLIDTQMLEQMNNILKMSSGGTAVIQEPEAEATPEPAVTPGPGAFFFGT